MSSISGLGLRNKVGLGKPKESSSKPKQPGSSITGLGLRNKAAGLTGNKKDPDQAARDRYVTPQSALIDPSSFAPPPKNINYNGAASTDRPFDKVSRKGPLTPAEYRAKEEEKAKWEREEAAREKEQQRVEREARLRLKAEQQGEDEASGSRLPYRNDSTGLSTNQFAPPVARGAAADGSIVIRPTALSKPKPKPPLPPRLPGRQNSNSKVEASFPALTYGSKVVEPPLYRGQVNQGSLDRLSAASASVPGIRIGLLEQPPTEYRERPQLPVRTSTASSFNSPPTTPGNSQLGELQSRFARMRESSSRVEAPTQGPIWAGSVEKSSDQHEDLGSPIVLRDNTVMPVKKAPPPRPQKRAELLGSSTKAGDGPPPIPLLSKPR